jgi:hypothetical protein
MSNNQKLFKDAIADAKVLREVAIANAKTALEESFSPRIQSMFEKRIMEAEEIDEEELDEKITYQGDKDNLIDSLDESEDDMMDEEDSDLEELFNSLSEEDMTDEGMDMDDMDDMGDMDDMDEEEYDLEEILRELEADSLEENEEEIDEYFSFDDKSPEGQRIKNKPQDILNRRKPGMAAADVKGYSDVVNKRGATGKAYGMTGPKGSLPEEEELYENTMFEKASADEEIKDVTVEELRDLIRDAIKAAMGDSGMDSDEDMETIDLDMDSEDEMDIDLDMDSEEEDKDSKKKPKKDDKKDDKKDKMDERRRYKGIPKMEEGYDEKELEEAINTINILRSQLNEVNLLNAKLIYVNKIFKANNLNESQKVKVVNSFDKAKTLNEAKNIYEVLKDTVKTSSKLKTPLRESKQFASNIIGNTSARKPILESNDVITRMQKLAGII